MRESWITASTIRYRPDRGAALVAALLLLWRATLHSIRHRHDDVFGDDDKAC